MLANGFGRFSSRSLTAPARSVVESKQVRAKKRPSGRTKELTEGRVTEWWRSRRANNQPLPYALLRAFFLKLEMQLSEMRTSDGAMAAVFPPSQLRPLDFSIWLRRALSSRHKSDSEQGPLYRREAREIVAVVSAGMELAPLPSRLCDAFAYRLR